MAGVEIQPCRDGSPAMIDGYLRLMGAILLQSMIDLERGDVVDKVTAILFLSSEEAAEIGELLGITDVWRFYVSGCKIPTKVKRRGASAKGWRVE